MSRHTTATLGGLVVALFGPLILAIAGQRWLQAADGFLPHLLGLAVLIAMVAGVLWIVLRRECRSLASIGLQPFRWQTLAWGVALAAFFMVLFAPAAYWLLAQLHLGGFEAGLARSASLPLWFLIAAVLVGSIAEEVLYRGYAVERLGELTGSYRVAGIISVLVFGLAHVPMWGWGPALTTMVSGAILTLFFIWRKDLTANIIAHFVTDFAGIVIVPLLAATRGA
jgi:membrane protease YdiL (CAAX protease family)